MRDLVDHGTFVRLSRSRDFLAANLERPVRFTEAAGEACLSPFHYHRLFHRAFGETPHNFLVRLRIEHARRLLTQTDLPVTEVCLAVGYESLGSFSLLFRSATGCPPSEYRRTARRIFAIPAIAPCRFVPTCLLRYYGIRVF